MLLRGAIYHSIDVCQRVVRQHYNHSKKNMLVRQYVSFNKVATEVGFKPPQDGSHKKQPLHE